MNDNQAQAGEPVVHHTINGEEFISMKSHREAMAPLEADRQKLRRIEAAMKIKGGDEHYPTEWAYLQACKVIDAQREAIAKKDAALKFYADGDHFIRHDADAWDTVSGEPQNLWCDEADTATVEDGSIARAAITQGQEAMK